jgi:hypothetical protein
VCSKETIPTFFCFLPYKIIMKKRITAPQSCTTTRIVVYALLLLASIGIFLVAFIASPTEPFFVAAFPSSWNQTRVDYASPELSFPSKCVDCERAFPPGQKWRAQQTKCFDCEHNHQMMGGPQYTHPNKCLDCER